MRRPPIVVALLLVILAAVVIPLLERLALASTDRPAAYTSATCSDYSNQRDAQLKKDTRDADGDGIYCEDLPCPCLKPGGGGGPQPTPTHKPRGLRCGKERWSVKTLSDSRAKLVDFDPKDTTVNQLGSKPSPGIGRSDPRIKGVETTTYRVEAQLIEAKREEDRDIHLVIASPDNPRATMIVEFPDVRCQGTKQSKKRNAIHRARAAFEGACGTPSSSSFRKLNGTATITGVGFFDVKHGQRGIAPNGIELHPVLRYRSGGCERG
jgi:hypothetical protein